jgi:hypothetical protein
MRFLLAILLLPTLAFAQFPTVSVTDTFDGTANPIGGIWTNSVFGSTNGGCQKVAGIAKKSGGTSLSGCYVTEAFDAGQEVYVTFTNPQAHSNNTLARVLGCLQSGSVGTTTASGYSVSYKKIDLATDQIRIYRYDGGVSVAISDPINQEFAVGDSMGMEIQANGTITAYYKPSAGSWSAATSTIDTTYNCANTHVGLNIGNTSHEMDNFGGGEIVIEEPPPPPPTDFPSTPILDNFNRANEQPLAGIWTNNIYGSPSGGCQTTLNSVIRWGPAGSGNETGCYVTEAFGDNQEVYLDFGVITTVGSAVANIPFCVQSAGIGTSGTDGYELRHQWQEGADDVIGIYRNDNGVRTLLGTTMTAPIAEIGDKIGVRALADGTFTAYFKDGAADWVELGVRSDTTYDCANTRIGLNIRTADHRFDNVGGGSIGGSPPVLGSGYGIPMEFK